MIEALPPVPSQLPIYSLPLPMSSVVEDATFAAIYAGALEQDEIDATEESREIDYAAYFDSLKKGEQAVKQTQIEPSAFAYMFAGVVRSLQQVSQIERKANRLIDGFARGDVSPEEVTIATSQLNVAMTLTTTVLNSSTQALKEISSMQI